MTNGKVILVQGHGEQCRNPVLLPPFDFTVDNREYWTVDGRYKFNKELLYSTTLNAERVIFYCNGALSRSPRPAREYLKFLQENHPESKQKVNIVTAGAYGIKHFIERFGDSKTLMKKYFRM